MSAFGASIFYDISAARGAHSAPETVSPHAFNFARIVSSCGHESSLPIFLSSGQFFLAAGKNEITQAGWKCQHNFCDLRKYLFLEVL